MDFTVDCYHSTFVRTYLLNPDHHIRRRHESCPASPPRIPEMPPDPEIRDRAVQNTHHLRYTPYQFLPITILRTGNALLPYNNDEHRPIGAHLSRMSNVGKKSSLETRFITVVPACGLRAVYLRDTRMLRNVDRKSSYPHCGDNRVDNVCDYPHIGDNSVDSLGTIRSRHRIDLHQSRQSAMRSDLRSMAHTPSSPQPPTPQPTICKRPARPTSPHNSTVIRNY